MILFIYSSSLFIGFLAGSSSMLQPLGFLNKPLIVQGVASQEAQKKSFIVINSIEELDALLEENKGKKILLDFAADWCTSCRELEEITFADEKVAQKMSEFVLIRADVTKNSDKEKALSQKYGVFGPPVLIFFDENSEVQKAKTIVGL
ncbi:MAG: thioredoxin fold domain-containing protein [Sulfurimonas sp.]|nr:thioredoxin fold domain-containing protein [Sulfurimonas sp.]